MAIAVQEETHLPSSSRTGGIRPPHENLITDALLHKALQAILILQVTDKSGRIRARQLRETAQLSLVEAIQVLRYLHRQEVLQEEVEGSRSVNISLAREYLSIIVQEDRSLNDSLADDFTPFQIAWACMHAQTQRLTRMRVARPSKWTIAWARTLGLTMSETPGELIFPLSRAQRLCERVEKMGEAERAASVTWAQQQMHHASVRGNL